VRPDFAVLGIDAAWTSKNPSGLALLQRRAGRWSWLAIAPSQDVFLSSTPVPPHAWTRPTSPRPLDVARILAASRALLAGREIDVVAVDMPIATAPFDARRNADDALSAAYGAKKAAVHSPTKERPGKVGTDITAAFRRAGYAVATAATPAGARRHILEVYPHAALIELLRLDERLPYKVARSTKLWPGLDPPARRRRIVAAFETILHALERVTAPAGITLPSGDDDAPLARLKPYEDALDAMVCAWVAACYADGKVRAFGDATAAIWTPLAPP